MTKSHLLIEDNENMIFRLKSGRSHYKQMPAKVDQSSHIILSECSEANNSEEIDNFISND
jgi:hypothetical protein